MGQHDAHTLQALKRSVLIVLLSLRSCPSCSFLIISATGGPSDPFLSVKWGLAALLLRYLYMHHLCQTLYTTARLTALPGHAFLQKSRLLQKPLELVQPQKARASLARLACRDSGPRGVALSQLQASGDLNPARGWAEKVRSPQATTAGEGAPTLAGPRRHPSRTPAAQDTDPSRPRATETETHL